MSGPSKPLQAEGHPLVTHGIDQHLFLKSQGNRVLGLLRHMLRASIPLIVNHIFCYSLSSCNISSLNNS